MTNQTNFSASSPSSSRSNSSQSLGVIENSLRHYERNQPTGGQPSPLRCFLGALIRKKPLDGRTDTNLKRCLNLLDLTSLGKCHLFEAAQSPETSYSFVAHQRQVLDPLLA